MPWLIGFIIFWLVLLTAFAIRIRLLQMRLAGTIVALTDFLRGKLEEEDTDEV